MGNLQKIELNEILRIKLMINYKTSKTLDENLSLIYEQSAGGMLYPSEDRLKREKEEYEKETYPLYCKYPDRALIPQNKEGVEGDEALVKSSGGTKFCLYRSMNKAGNEGIWIPDKSEITFTSLRHIQYNVDTFFEKYPNYMTKDELINNLSNLFLPNGREVVSSFSIGPVLYTSNIQFDTKSKRWWFSGYKDTNKKLYPMPEWGDPRSDTERFIDDFGTVIYMAVIISVSLLAPQTMAGIITTVIVDLGLSSVIAFRDLEKGNNIGAVFGVLFALLPIANLSNKWLGISDDITKQLSQSFAKSNLNSKSKPSDWVKFYNGLPAPQQKGLSKILNYKKTEIERMSQEIAEQFGKRGKQIEKILPDGIQKLIDADPNILKNIPFLEKLAVKNLGLVGVLFLIDYVIQKTKGEEWNDESKKKFEEVYSIVSPDLQALLLMSALANYDNINDIYNAQELERIQKNTMETLNSDIEEGTKKLISDKYVATATQDTVNNNGGIEIPDFKKYQAELIYADSVEVQKYRDKEYVPLLETNSELNINFNWDFDNPIIINDTPWVKKIE